MGLLCGAGIGLGASLGPLCGAGGCYVGLGVMGGDGSIYEASMWGWGHLWGLYMGLGAPRWGWGYLWGLYVGLGAPR